MFGIPSQLFILLVSVFICWAMVAAHAADLAKP
jgi:hypothetical protein